MKFSSQIDRALVAQWEALEEKNKDAATKDRVLCPRQATKKLIARAQDN
jgi:hypothetical protein